MSAPDNTLAGELFAPGVGAQAGPPTTPADSTGVTPGAHSHGGPAPTGSPAERFTSTDPDAFGVPTGREETWRFTPMKRIRVLLDGAGPPCECAPGATPEASAGVVGGPAWAPTPGAKSSPARVLSGADISRRHLPSAVR